jgi:hypothetical protein
MPPARVVSRTRIPPAITRSRTNPSLQRSAFAGDRAAESGRIEDATVLPPRLLVDREAPFQLRRRERVVRAQGQACEVVGGSSGLGRRSAGPAIEEPHATRRRRRGFVGHEHVPREEVVVQETQVVHARHLARELVEDPETLFGDLFLGQERIERTGAWNFTRQQELEPRQAPVPRGAGRERFGCAESPCAEPGEVLVFHEPRQGSAKQVALERVPPARLAGERALLEVGAPPGEGDERRGDRSARPGVQDQRARLGRLFLGPCYEFELTDLAASVRPVQATPSRRLRRVPRTRGRSSPTRGRSPRPERA